MGKVGIHAPKSPVTKGSTGTAPAAVPNVCKMPGPPAPFVPTPLPNIAKSGTSPKGYSKKVKIEGQTCAIRGASFKSLGDVASKATGGGLVSMNTHGPAKFISPGSLTVKIEGKSVHLLGEQMLNNCGASGNPPNTGSAVAVVQPPAVPALSILQDIAKDCDAQVSPTDAKNNKKTCTKLGTEKHDCCEKKIQDHRALNPPDGQPPVEGEQGYARPALDGNNRPIPNPDGTFPAPVPVGAPRPNIAHAYATGGKGSKIVGQTFKAMKNNCYPDAAILNSDGSKTFCDFKFPCPAGHPCGKTKSGKQKISKGGAKTTMSAQQQGSYDGLCFGSGSSSPALVISP